MYQGAELWDYRLVDPDNRGPVDFEVRKKMLAEMHTLSVAEILERMESGMPKLWTVHKALEVRQRFSECFGPQGDYRPIYPTGEMQEHVVAFVRDERIATVVPRLSFGVKDQWYDTAITLPVSSWRNAYTGERFSAGIISVAQLFATFPVALLTRED